MDSFEADSVARMRHESCRCALNTAGLDPAGISGISGAAGFTWACFFACFFRTFALTGSACFLVRLAEKRSGGIGNADKGGNGGCGTRAGAGAGGRTTGGGSKVACIPIKALRGGVADFLSHGNPFPGTPNCSDRIAA